ncbi:conserved hypothetical protein [Paraburkholderia atlantica]|uniref:Uncharacterized protein n=1 Tax=Paraburkholderia atlantica TaxID=2654982 RepID=D5WE81_PARAM|nr:conserved hypothetical protein [Paraburkholderia atlantica]
MQQDAFWRTLTIRRTEAATAFYRGEDCRSKAAQKQLARIADGNDLFLC